MPHDPMTAAKEERMKDARIELGESAEFCGGNELTGWTRAGGEAVYLSINNPWAGDTESGFGATCSINLSRDDARKLAGWLLDCVGETR